MKTSFPSVGSFHDSEPVETQPSPRRNPQTTAWIVISTAFGIFWLLVVVAFVGAKHFYDTAVVAQTGTLTRELGIVLFRDAISSNLMNAQDNLSLRQGDELLVDQAARASVLFFDGSWMRIYSGSEVRLSELQKSRFHDGFSVITVHFKNGMGRFVLGDEVTDSRRFMVTTPHGNAVLSKGSFGVLVTDTSTRFSSHEGTALVESGGKTVVFGANEKAIITPTQLTGPLPEGDQLIANGDFAQGFTHWQPLDINEPGRDPEPGQRMLVPEVIDGRESLTLQVERVSRKATHNETGLIQYIDKDVSDYSVLRMDADVRVDEQSLSGGGYMGYEYPMMLRIRYRDAHGRQIDWSHGFFHKNPENRPTPNGQWLPQGQWYHYDGDLMEVEPKPVHIISIEVLGAGHSFLSSIANISLVGK
ncbi:MAG: hypothetical protein ACOX87_07250 [Chloroflexota bacterium]|jgi:hypothetical protein